MKAYYEQDGITIYHGDCREVTIPAHEALISDPPWGMYLNTDTRRFSGGNRKRGNGQDRKRIHGDNEPFDPTPWLQAPKIILWGFNHFAQRLPVGTTLIWIKKYDYLFGTFLSDAEIAWMKGGHGVYANRCEWSNTNRMAVEDVAFAHPTQKPVSLMRWCIGMCKLSPNSLIVDPYMGSGSTLVAAKMCGHRAVGIEVDESYCEIAAKRLAQGVLFGAGVA